MSQPKIKSEKKKPNVLVIAFDPETNEIKCDGPFADGVLFLGMLEMAKLLFLEGRLGSMIDLKLKRKDERKILIPGFPGPN